MTTDAYTYLLPESDPGTQPHWEALRKHELVIQACADCGVLRHVPRSVCAACGSERVDWTLMSGRATVYSFVIVHRPNLPMWRQDAPYHVVMVSLDDAPHIRLYGNVVGVENSELAIGMKLTAVFDDVTPTDTLLRWAPAVGA